MTYLKLEMEDRKTNFEWKVRKILIPHNYDIWIYTIGKLPVISVPRRFLSVVVLLVDEESVIG